MIGFIETVNNAVNSFVWGVPMLILLVGTGILMTCLTKVFQLSHFGYWMRHTIGSIFTEKHITEHTEKGDASITQFQSLCTALAATVGTGNLVGIAGAICLGGPGAVFWMLVFAFFGMAVKYAEAVLAVKFQEKRNGEVLGGTMYIRSLIHILRCRRIERCKYLWTPER